MIGVLLFLLMLAPPQSLATPHLLPDALHFKPSLVLSHMADMPYEALNTLHILTYSRPPMSTSQCIVQNLCDGNGNVKPQPCPSGEFDQGSITNPVCEKVPGNCPVADLYNIDDPICQKLMGEVGN